MYKLIDEKWYKCRYYFFRDARTALNQGQTHNQFYCKAIQEASGYLPPVKLGNVVTSVPYGWSDFWGPTGTLTPAPGKELRTYIGPTWSESWKARIDAYNVYGAIDYKIIVEWDIATDDISKVFFVAAD